MKQVKHLFTFILFFQVLSVAGQNDVTAKTNSVYPMRRLTLEPAIGIKPYPNSDVLFSNVVQWNPKKKLSIISYSAWSYNNAFLRTFNYIRTDYNYSFSQQFGIGTTFYAKHASHTFSVAAGIKYDAYQETLVNPAFEDISVSVSSWSPDASLNYQLKVGRKKTFFTYRMSIPLYPYPFKTTDINAIDGNLANVTMEFGIGIRLK